MSFHVKWLNYDDLHNTWEPWKNFRLCDALHVYLRNNDMSRFTPKNLEESTDEVWVCHMVPDVADTQVDRLLQAELSVKWSILSGDNSVDYAWLDYWQAKGNNRAILQ